jgi:ssDNA thymidine ADP-ribosyltransferase, DarT
VTTPPPNPTDVFHITAIKNLPDIATAKGLVCKKTLDGNSAAYQSIAYANLQNRRASKVVRAQQTLHEFVPFTFAPRSPMLSAIHNGNVQGFNGTQNDIAHLVSDAQTAANASLDFLISDFHAVVAYATFYSALSDLDKIDWALFFEAPRIGGYSRWWFSDANKQRYLKRSETRQAEFLVHGMFPLTLIREIGVANDSIASKVTQDLQRVGWQVPVRARPEWYY